VEQVAAEKSTFSGRPSPFYSGLYTRAYQRAGHIAIGGVNLTCRFRVSQSGKFGPEAHAG